MKRILSFATIALVLTLDTAHASSVVTSKAYVDAMDDTKVDIAQGTGDNNANVGKTLVVNSSGNLELGTPAAGNYVEDSITDGVTTKAPSEDAVHDALEDKQDTIDTAEVDMNGFDLPAIVTYDTTNALVGNRIGILDQATIEDDELRLEVYYDGNYPDGEMDNYVPTVRAVANGLDAKQDTITTSMVTYTEPEEQINYQLPSLVAYDSTSDINGNQIGILGLENGGSGLTFLSEDMDPWDSSTAVYDNYVPTVRTVAAGLEHVFDIMPSAFFWNSNNATAVNNYSTSFTGTGNWPSEHEDRYVTGRSLAQGLALKQNRQIGASPVGNANSTDAGKVLIVGNDGNITMGTSLADKQDVIQGYNSSTGDKSVLTDTTTDGVIGKMTLYDSNSADSDIWVNPEGYDNYIPTAGALGQIAALKQNNLGGSDNAGKVVTATANPGNVTYTGIDTTVTNASSNLVTSGGVYTALNTKQKQKTCAGWLDGTTVPDDTHTDANCVLWNLPD